MANPKTLTIDPEPSMLYAVSYMVADKTTEKNLPILMDYINRLPIEFCTITLQNILRKNRKLLSTPAIQTWIREKGADLF